MTRILVLNGTLVTMESREKVIREGYVYIEDDTIVGLGKVDELPEEYRAADLVLDAFGKVVIPGFVSAHTHLSLCPIGFKLDGYRLDEWVECVAWPYEKALTGEIARASSLIALSELVLNGVVCVADMHFHMDHVAKVVEKMGIYANLSIPIMRGGPYDDEKEALKDALKLYERWHGACDGRITVSLAPCSIRLVSKEVLEEVASIAGERGLIVHMHLSEVKEDVEYSKKTYGVRPVEFLAELGLVHDRSLFAHGVWLSMREVKLLARGGASVAHCPSVNALLFDGVAPVPELLRDKVNVCLGVDCSPRLNIVHEAFISDTVLRVVYGPPRRLTSFDYLKFMTVNGARALKLDYRIGVLKEGMKATLVILDLKPAPTLTPDEIYDMILLSEPRAETVIIDGDVIVDGGELLVVSREELRAAWEKLASFIEGLKEGAWRR